MLHLGTKKMIQPLMTKKKSGKWLKITPNGSQKNHTTFWDIKKNHATSRDKMAKAKANGYGDGPTLSQTGPNGPKWSNDLRLRTKD